MPPSNLYKKVVFYDFLLFIKTFFSPVLKLMLNKIFVKFNESLFALIATLQFNISSVRSQV